MKSDDKYQKEKNRMEDMRQVYSLIFIAANKLQAEVDHDLEELTSRQLMLLMAIAHCEPEEATIMNISAMLGVTKQNSTRMVQTLCKKGILISNASEIDKRSVNIQLTEKGKSLLEENIPKGYAYFLKIFKDFSASEITAFRHFMEKLCDYDDRKQVHLEKPLKAQLDIDEQKIKLIYEKRNTEN